MQAKPISIGAGSRSTNGKTKKLHKLAKTKIPRQQVSVGSSKSYSFNYYKT